MDARVVCWLLFLPVLVSTYTIQENVESTRADVQNKEKKDKEKETLYVGGRDIYIIPVVYTQTNAIPGANQEGGNVIIQDPVFSDQRDGLSRDPNLDWPTIKAEIARLTKIQLQDHIDANYVADESDASTPDGVNRSSEFWTPVRDQQIDERDSNYISSNKAYYYYPQSENEYSEEQYQDPYVQNSDPYVQDPYGNAYSDVPYQDYNVPQADYTATYQFNNNQIGTSYYNQYTSDNSGEDQFDPAISSTGSYDDHNEFTANQRKDDHTHSELSLHSVKPGRRLLYIISDALNGVLGTRRRQSAVTNFLSSFNPTVKLTDDISLDLMEIAQEILLQLLNWLAFVATDIIFVAFWP